VRFDFYIVQYNLKKIINRNLHKNVLEPRFVDSNLQTNINESISVYMSHISLIKNLEICSEFFKILRMLKKFI